MLYEVITIVALLSEKTEGKYKGALAIGASMTLMEDDGSTNVLTNAPQIPVLFLTNQSELKNPQDYISKYKNSYNFV